MYRKPVKMQILLTLRIYLVDDLQNPRVVIPIWQDTHLIVTQVLGIVMLHKVFKVYVMYKQGTTGFEYDIRFIEQK